MKKIERTGNRGILILGAVLILVILFIVLALSLRTGLSGKYYSQDNALINYIEFGKNRTIRLQILGMNTKDMKYQVKKDMVSVNVPTRGETLFRIMDSSTIKGVSSGFEGTYIKNKPKRF